jgi:hypothetical protein
MHATRERDIKQLIRGKMDASRPPIASYDGYSRLTKLEVV